MKKIVSLKYVANFIAGQSPSFPFNTEHQGLEFHQGKTNFSNYLIQESDVYCKQPEKIAPKGSILISMRAPAGEVNVTDREIGIGRGLGAIVPYGIDRDYLFYYLKSLNDQFRVIEKGSTFMAIDAESLLNIKVVLPCKEEQKSIANRLNKKVNEIDSLISLCNAYIDRLGEARQSLVTRAVTKGLDPTVPMKDSGISWIGEVPAHWEIARVGFLYRLSNGLSKSGEYFGTGYPFVSYGDVYKNTFLPSNIEGLVNSSDQDRISCSVRRGDVFFTRTSETVDELGFSSVSLRDVDNSTFAGFLIRARPISKALYPEYCGYYFRSDVHRNFFIKETSLVTRASLSQTLLNKLPVLIPPISEQEEIYKYCYSVDRKIKTVLKNITEQVGLLNQYRTSLISEIIEVRNDEH